MDIEVDTFEQVDSFMKQQQKKIDSWLPFDNMLIPTGIMEQQEQKKVNMLRMIFKMLLINTRDVLNGLIVLEATNNMTSSMILHKTLIENTINIAYARKFYKTKDYHSFCNLIKGNKALFGNKTVNQKANISFVKSEG
ncbi:abortive infection protein, partial [Lactococcus lactis]